MSYDQDQSISDKVKGAVENVFGKAKDAVDDVQKQATSNEQSRDTAGQTTDDAMTRSEEHMRVGTAEEETGKARISKNVVTEEETHTIPVSHEELRIEREPVTEANRDAATSGPEISEDEHEVTLHAERPVVEKEAVPVERVKLDTETVTDQETVSGDVRKEQIGFEGDAEPRRS